MERVDSGDLEMGESFSLTSFNLIDSSSPVLIDEDSDSDDESFIEISLVSKSSIPLVDDKYYHDDNDDQETLRNESAILPSSSSTTTITLSCSSQTCRRLSNMTEKVPESITMKLYIKLRSVNIVRTLFEALAKPQKKTKTFEGGLRSYAQNLMKLFDKNHEAGDNSRNTGIIKKRDGDRTKGFEVMNLEAIRGVLQFMSTGINGRKHRRTQSCPSSNKCSPVHRGYAANDQRDEMYSVDSSIKAAIAHCKTSFGRSSRLRL